MTGGGHDTWRTYKETVLGKVTDFSTVFSEYLKDPKPSGDDWMVALCPLHADKTPSFGFNKKSGRWRCFAGCGKGGPLDFIMLTTGQSFKDVLLDLGDRYGVPRPATSDKPDRPPIPEDLVRGWEAALWANEDVLRWLREKRGFTDITLKKYQIGWDAKRQRNTIPIRDERGNIVNVRLYSGKKDAKMINYTEGVHKYGSPARLYGVDELTKYLGQWVVICEGEWDRLLLQQEGFMAVTGTHGCSVFRPEWFRHFKGKNVAVIFDCDQEGQKGATSLIEGFRGTELASIRNIRLPLRGSKDDKDITDYFHKRGLSKSNLQKLVQDTAAHDYTVKQQEEKTVDLESFTEVERKDLIDKRVRVPITACGETSEAFHAVEEFRISSCHRMAKGSCFDCKGMSDSYALPRGAQEFIGSCMSSNVQVKAMIRDFACKHGQKPAIEILKRTTIKEFFCHQRVNRLTQMRDEEGNINQIIDGKKQELMEKRVYYLSSEHPKPGNYLATGWIKSHPKTQQVTMLIEELEALEDDYEGFQLQEVLPHLKAFREIVSGEKGWATMLDDLTRNVTRVYERDEILLAILFTYLSPRWIRFNGEIIRGWLVCLIIGDSGSGKTQTYQRLSEFVNVGDILSGLTASRTGLAYALVEHQQRGWQVRIGRYPANSRKILTVDEAQHLPEWDMRAISKAMEEGFLQIDRVQSRGYESQTRLIMIANPRRDLVMDTFSFGCESMKKLYPPTIIRRTDFAVFANVGDLKDLSFINRKSDADVHPKIAPIMLRSLIFWVWNLRPEQVVFSDGAEDACLNKAKEMTESFGYAADIPLITLSDFRKKLARISAAVAALQVSTDDAFMSLIVKTSHVDIAAKFLDTIYRHDNCGLDDYSDIQKLGSQLLDYDEIEKSFLEKWKNEQAYSPNDKSNFPKAVMILRISEFVRRDDLAEQVGCSLDTCSTIIRFLKKYNMVATDIRGYVKKPKFNKFLRRFVKAHPEFFKGVAPGGLGTPTQAESLDIPEEFDT